MIYNFWLDSTLIPKKEDFTISYSALAEADISGWASYIGLYISEEYKGDSLWIYISCPWATGHSTSESEKDTALVQSGEGCNFTCFHSHCSGYTFFDVLDIVGKETLLDFLPDWYRNNYSTNSDFVAVNTDIEILDKETKETKDTVETKETKETKETVETKYTDTDLINSIEIDDDIFENNEFTIKESVNLYDHIKVIGIDEKGLPVIIKDNIPHHYVVKATGWRLEQAILIYPNSAAWIKEYGEKRKRGKNKVEYVFNPTAALEDIVERANKEGPLDYKKSRKKGIYSEILDGKEYYIINTGKSVYDIEKNYNFSYFEAFNAFPKFWYKPSHTNNIQFDEEELSVENRIKFFKIIKNLPFESGVDRTIFTGILLAGTINGVHQQMPVGHIQGPTGSGKTQIAFLICKPIWQKAGGLCVTQGTTAAGIDQAADGDVPILYDELESATLQNEKVVRDVQSGMLSATTGEGSEQIKGTQIGKSITHSRRSTYITISRAFDANQTTIKRRTAIINLTNSTKDQKEGWEKFRSEIIKTLDYKFTTQLMKYMINRIPSYRKYYNAIVDFIVEEIPEISQHQLTLYAVILTSHAIFRFTSFEKINKKKLKKVYYHMIKYLRDNQLYEDENQNEETNQGLKILNVILTSSVRTQDGDKTFQTLIYNAATKIDAFSSSILEEHGIKVINEVNGRKILGIVNNQTNLIKIIKQSGYTHYKFLSEIKGAKNSVLKISGKSRRCIKIPLDYVLDRDSFTSYNVPDLSDVYNVID